MSYQQDGKHVVYTHFPKRRLLNDSCRGSQYYCTTMKLFYIHPMCYDNSRCGGECVYLTYNPEETILLDVIYTRKELSCRLLLTA